MIELQDENFELSLLFKDSKEPIEAFGEFKNFFESLISLDDIYLKSISPGSKSGYILQSLEFSSIKTWILQILKNTPDEAIKDLDWKKLLGIYLVKLKYRIIKYLEENPVIDSSEQIIELGKSIEVEKKQFLKNHDYLITEVNPFELLNNIEPLINYSSQLKEDEKLQFNSVYGNAIISNKMKFNKSKILFELGNEENNMTTIEVLKIVKIELLSDNPTWNFKLKSKDPNFGKNEGKIIAAKILDLEWLNKFHSREFPILPNDSLKVNLRSSYVKQGDGIINKPSYEILKIIEIIYPEDIQINLFTI